MTMRSLLKHLALAMVVIGALAAPTAAQTLIDNTTLSAAITATANTITLAAVTCTNCTFGQDTLLFVDREAMRVTGQYSAGSGNKVVFVRRGTDGTVAAAHANAAVVIYGPANRFHLVALGTPGNGDPEGPCGARSSQPFLPWVNVLSGNTWSCDGSGAWYGTNVVKLSYNSGPLSGAQ